MSHFLLIDFGTTSTKSALLDLDSGLFTPPESYPALANIADREGRCEYALAALTERFNSICSSYY